VSPAKTAERTEMPFGFLAQMVQRNHMLDGGPELPWEGATLGEGIVVDGRS